MDLDVVLECLWVWKLTYGLSSNVCFPLASGRPVSGLGWGRPATWIIRRKTDTASKAVGRGDVRQNPGESGTKASTVSWWQWEDPVVPAHLIQLGQQALANVTSDVANGAPLVRCQLLASEFYEALKPRNDVLARREYDLPAASGGWKGSRGSADGARRDFDPASNWH